MRIPDTAGRAVRLILSVVVAAVAATTAIFAMQEAQPAPPPAEAVPADRVPVRLGGEPVFYLLADVGGFPAAQRAERIENTLREIVRDRSVTDLTVRLEPLENATDLRVGTTRIVVATQPDADAAGVARDQLAQVWATEIQRALRAERALYEPQALVRGAVTAAIATVVLIGAFWVLRRLTRAARTRAHRELERHLDRLKARDIDPRSARSIELLVGQTIAVIGVVLALALLDAYLTLVFSGFPWTREAATALGGLISAPVRVGWEAFIGFLPNAFFLVFIAVVTLYVTRFTRLFFDAVAVGRIEFTNFPADWADPTYKTVRVVIIAFALVVAFPYLPGSSSPAFAGISVFVGVLFSLASSSSLSNIMAGLVLTYSGGFKVGDYVKLGETLGTVAERGLLATRLRTLKNVDVVVPNGIVLGGQIINYSTHMKTRGLIVPTSVTIGYDAPWRQIHELLLAAARATPDVRDDPPPFVLQTALNDFYVTYELNVYINGARPVVFTYSDLHANIQDKFFEAGVEIMSPHYTSLRDGSTVAMPEAYRPKDYEAPRFRVASRAEGPGTPRDPQAG